MRQFVCKQMKKLVLRLQGKLFLKKHGTPDSLVREIGGSGFYDISGYHKMLYIYLLCSTYKTYQSPVVTAFHALVNVTLGTASAILR